MKFVFVSFYENLHMCSLPLAMMCLSAAAAAINRFIDDDLNCKLFAAFLLFSFTFNIISISSRVVAFCIGYG